MISGGKIPRSRQLLVAVAVLLTGGSMVYWKIRGSDSTVHKSGHGVGPELTGGAGPREPSGNGADQPSKVNEPAKPDLPPPSSGNVRAFGENGRITTQAIENLNLTTDEVASLTRLLSAVKEQAAADFVSRTKLTENVSNADGGFRHTYFVKARPDRGMEFSNALATGCEALIGETRARKINSNLSSLNFLGGAGKYDLNIVVSSDGGQKAVRYEIIDPKGGRVLEVHECSYKSFSEAFGDVFAY